MSVDIIDTKAWELASLFEHQTFQNLNWYNEKISEELYAIKRPAEQKRFLARLRFHLEVMCKELGDGIKLEDEYATLIYAIDQFFEEINGVSNNLNDPFSAKEYQEMISRIDTIIQDMSELKAGNQLLFEELQELKQKLDLGKKNWKQLLTGKLVDMVVGGVVDKGIVEKVYESLLQTKDEFVSRILT